VTEATRPVEKPVAATAYIYNAYDTLRLQYLGQYVYEIPQGRVTRIDSLPEHREIDQHRSVGKNVEWHIIPLKGERIARELIELRGYSKKGVVVFTGNEDIPGKVVLIDGVDVPEKLVADATAAAESYMLHAIESFVVKREKAKAGISGFPMRPDAHIYNWMRKFRADDEMFAERHAKTDSNALLAAAVEKMAQMAERLSGAATIAVTDIPVRSKDEKYEAYAERMVKWGAQRINGKA
jgi:hypothetical protein